MKCHRLQMRGLCTAAGLSTSESHKLGSVPGDDVRERRVCVC